MLNDSGFGFAIFPVFPKGQGITKTSPLGVFFFFRLAILNRRPAAMKNLAFETFSTKSIKKEEKH